MVTKMASQQKILRSVYYEIRVNTVEASSVGNIILYHPRKDEFRGPRECGVPSRQGQSGTSTRGEEEKNKASIEEWLYPFLLSSLQLSFLGVYIVTYYLL